MWHANNKLISKYIMLTIPAYFQPYRHQLERVFIYYSSFGDKDNFSILKIQNYSRLLTDMQLVNNPSIISQYDVIFYAKTNSGQLNFSNFLLILEPVSNLAFANLPSAERIQRLLMMHIQPLHDYIMSQTEFGRSVKMLNATLFKQHSYVFLNRFTEGLSVIYTNYFMKSGQPGWDEQFKNFIKLSKQLNIIPKIITKPIAYLLFNFLIQRESQIVFYSASAKVMKGLNVCYKFDFQCFLDYLILASHMNYPGEEKDQIKIYRLLQSVQVSQGLQKLSKTIKFKHFYLSNEDLESAVNIEHEPYVFIERKMSKNAVKTIESPMKNRLGDYYELLKARFVKLCIKKHVQSNFYLESSVAKKLLTKTCPKLSGVSIDLMISSVGRLNFENFVNLLNIVAEKLNVEYDQLYDQVALYNETQSQGSGILDTRLEQEQLHQCLHILQLTQSYLRSLFEFYQFKGVLSLNNYLRLMHQTEVSPSILSNMQASSIYSSCTAHVQQMTFAQFEASWLKMIVSVHFQSELESVERLLYLLEKVCNSRRGEALMKKNVLMVKEHPLYKLKLIFNDSYKSLQSKLSNYG